MRRFTAFVLVLTTVAVLARTTRAAPPAPVLVELFTSEGCSSCPPADALLQTLVDNPPAGVEIVALGQHVDYWDQLGWKDRFSSAAFTRRQQAYSFAFNNASSYTPQMVVDGRAELVGSDAGAARKAIERVMSLPHGSIRITTEPPAGDRVFVSVAASGLPRAARDRADIMVAVTEDRLRSDVKRGENHGRLLAHAAVVRELKTIGEATGAESSARTEVTLAPDWQRANLKVVAFVQERTSRHVLGAASVPLQNALR